MPNTRLYNEDGTVIKDAHTHITKRTEEREQEDSKYLPVIVKRQEGVTRHPDDILEHAIEEGLEQYQRTNLSLFLSAIVAGLILGFSALCLAILYQEFPNDGPDIVKRLGQALIYPLGFIICIMSGNQLFTEHTATAVYPLLDNRVRLKQLALLWALVLFGNIVGTFMSSSLMYATSSMLMVDEGFIKVYEHLTHYSFLEVLLSGILAGWLMAQGAWLLFAATSSTTQLLCIFTVTFIIGFCGLHHSIAGSAEIFSGLMYMDSPNYFKGFLVLFSSILGNTIGGSIFVAILNYAHIRKTQETA